MSKSVRKAKSVSRCDQIQEENEVDPKKVRMDTDDQLIDIPSNSQGQTSQQRSMVPTLMSFPGTFNTLHIPSQTLGQTLQQHSMSPTLTSFPGTSSSPNPASVILASDDDDDDDDLDPRSISKAVTYTILHYVMNLPSGPLSRACGSPTEYQRFACSSNVQNGHGLLSKKEIKQMDEKTTLKLLYRQKDYLTRQLSTAKQELEDAKKNRDGVLGFMRESYQKAERDRFISQKRVEHYRQLAAEVIAKNNQKEVVARNNQKLVVARNNQRGPQMSAGTVHQVSAMDVRLVALISIFLSIHVNIEVTVDYICAYLQNIIPTVDARDVEDLMRRFPIMFQETTTGVGASLNKTWKYVAFQR